MNFSEFQILTAPFRGGCTTRRWNICKMFFTYSRGYETEQPGLTVRHAQLSQLSEQHVLVVLFWLPLFKRFSPLCICTLILFIFSKFWKISNDKLSNLVNTNLKYIHTYVFKWISYSLEKLNCGFDFRYWYFEFVMSCSWLILKENSYPQKNNFVWTNLHIKKLGFDNLNHLINQ